ncbi:hypothetical protein E1A91_A10G236800v1 [Gossypium mustelinum]|uniref:Uncharacterized protein n=1 Tax=Gossypium mustelinum TaxID=34275 RepID=A0A5D2XQS7_GOSMU|nr:hypothetical protein E1A91_A10G236800v1 [Gossypium mustelinum]
MITVSAEKGWVITDGAKGNPGANTLTSWFRIEKVSDIGCKFKYCPQYVEHAQPYATKLGENLMEKWYVWLSPLAMDGHFTLRKLKNQPWRFNKLFIIRLKAIIMHELVVTI